MRKLVAALACRNNGSRLYGKPLQNLDVEEGITILDHIISVLKKIEPINQIVLGISEGQENLDFVNFAEKEKIDYIIGDEHDVLSRLIQCGQKVGATDIFRMTSESPFPFYEGINSSWKDHIEGDFDATFLDDIIDGCGYEIITLDSLIYSHNNGNSNHRSELCTLFIRENYDKFNVLKIQPPDNLRRKDLRLTVDYPEDLIVCRKVYEKFKNDCPLLNMEKVVAFLDKNPHITNLVLPFCEEGYKTMYV